MSKDKYPYAFGISTLVKYMCSAEKVKRSNKKASSAGISILLEELQGDGISGLLAMEYVALDSSPMKGFKNILSIIVTNQTKRKANGY